MDTTNFSSWMKLMDSLCVLCERWCCFFLLTIIPCKVQHEEAMYFKLKVIILLWISIGHLLGQISPCLGRRSIKSSSSLDVKPRKVPRKKKVCWNDFVACTCMIFHKIKIHLVARLLFTASILCKRPWFSIWMFLERNTVSFPLSEICPQLLRRL